MVQTWKPIVSNQEAMDAELDANARSMRRLMKVVKFVGWRHAHWFKGWAQRLVDRLEHLVDVCTKHPAGDPWWHLEYDGKEF